MRILFLISVLAISLSSCVKEVTNIKLPSSTPKLVVGCFISPQNPLIDLTLTRSNPIFGAGHNTSGNSPVTDALVTIFNGTNSITLAYNTTDEQYQASAGAFPIIAGETYTLAITTPKGENVTATCTVPASNITSLTVDFIDTVSNSKTLNIRWQDISNQFNYYKVFGQTVEIDPVMGNTYADMDAGNSLHNDNAKDGKELSSKLTSLPLNSNKSKIAYLIYLLNIDVSYYLYQNSLNNYTYNDPFSEPSLIYTNIKGGLGVFAAYQQFYVIKP